ncbi:MAG: 50S ribosomal protein L25/general stress protein Ctc [Gammaproteobacteria bacterium]
MSQKFNLMAEERSDQGKGASRRLRRAGRVPAILYGGGRDPRALSFDHTALLRNLENESIYSSILTVTVGDVSQPCVLKDLQRHPAKHQIVHVDLQRVLEDVEIRVRVPVHFVNEEKAFGVKQEGGVVAHLMNEIEVECLPKHLPEFIALDIENMKLDEMIMLSEIKVPEGVVIVDLSHGDDDDQDQPVVAIQRIKTVVVDEEPEEGEEEVAPGEVPVAGAKDEDEEEDKGKD